MQKRRDYNKYRSEMPTKKYSNSPWYEMFQSLEKNYILICMVLNRD